MQITTTPRLYLRELTPDDAQHFYHLNLDPEVLQYTGDSAFSSVADARAFLENYNAYKKHGVGRWAVIRKEDEVFLGWCGLKYSEDKEEYDVGFRFFKKYWNQGYATEAAKACIDLGFNRFKLPAIVGRAMKANVGSIRVLEKIGLTYYKPFDFDGQDGVVYKVEREM